MYNMYIVIQSLVVRVWRCWILVITFRVREQFSDENSWFQTYKKFSKLPNNQDL